MIDGDNIRTNLFITQLQDDFLKKVNQSRSVAIRMIIDEKMHQHETMQGKITVDKNILYMLFVIIIGILILLIFQMVTPW